MSWEEDIQKKLEVFMGDGKSYFPLWQDAVKEVNYNVAEFNFPNGEGTLVRRRFLKNRKFQIKFHFVDEYVNDVRVNHLDKAREFEESAKDRRHWHIRHPYYGDIRCQPVSLRFDNKKHGVTSVTGEVIETILGVAPITKKNPTDSLKIKVEATNEISIDKYINTTPDVSPVLISFMNERIDSFERTYSPFITIEEESKKFKEALALARSYVSSYTNNALLAMRQIQAVAQFPAKIIGRVDDKITYILDEVRKTRQALFGLVNIPNTLKRLYQSIMSDIYNALFLSVATTSTTTNNSFVTSSQVNNQILRVGVSWDEFVTDLDDLQDINYNNGDSFVQDSDILINLQDGYNDTMSNLLDVLSESKKEMSIFIEEESNPIILTHRFYGLDNEDANLRFLIETNDLGFDENLIIKKDRLIKWYV